ncbi:hypothetical protein HFO56_24330 [Rhizobium laguerreae]|uniref:RNA ligase family protein n=1 Tax=Rhizobium laguerreae TaxID=1076926 RepID=UPI001C920EA7|nr:RNA ligase family protein [Rhizobium laguerreae]MBY3155458.1 hypothetical protein [Rhizobium laguerreae]
MHVPSPPRGPDFVKPPKPLGNKAYGSTPHLVGSRLGPGDYSLTQEHSDLFTGNRKRRNRSDRIIVTEKIDGSCVAVAKLDGDVVALQRAGYLAATSPFALHHAFDRWVAARRDYFDAFLGEDERVVGEWLHTAMGTRYDIVDPDRLFISFAIFHDRYSTDRAIYDEFRTRTDSAGLPRAGLISEGPGIGIEEVMEKLGERGLHDAIDGVEGAVWIMETDGAFNGVAKFVKADKVDGKYISGVTGGADIVNYRGPAF